MEHRHHGRKHNQPPCRLPKIAKPPAFTYLTNHAHALVALDADPAARVRDLAVTVGITERAVQRIISELERVKALERPRDGRRNQYRILREGHLRHLLESHCAVGGLLDWISGKEVNRQPR